MTEAAKVVDIKTAKATDINTGDGDDGAVEVDPLIWAYIAGLVDADGTVVYWQTPRKPKRGGETLFNRGVRVSITMSDLDVLEKIRSLSGYGKIYLERRAGVQNATKNIYRWQVCAREDFLSITEQLLPYMGSRKGAKMMEVRNLIEHWALLKEEAELVPVKAAKK